MSLARAFKIQMAGSLVQMFAQVFRGKLAAIFLGPAGVGVFGRTLFTGQAKSPVTPMFDRHSAVSTGALKNSTGLTEIVSFSTSLSTPLTLTFETPRSPVRVPSSSLSSVCRSMSLKLPKLGKVPLKSQ